MGGLAAGLSGLNAPLAEYSQQMRQLHQQTKMELARQVGEIVRQYPPDSAEYQQGIEHLNGILGTQPGKDNTSLFNKVTEWLHPHPNNVKGMQQLYSPQNQPKTTQQAPPGPAGPGQTPGVPGIQPIPPHEQEPLDIPSGFLAAMGAVPSLNGQGAPPMQQPAAPPAAQPATNPLQLKTQAAASASPQIPPVQQSAAPAPFDPMSAIPQPLQKFVNSDSYLRQQQLQPYLIPEAQHQAALRQSVDLRQLDLGERQKALKNMDLESLPPALRAQWTAWAHSTSAPLPQLQAGLMRPVNTPGTLPTSAIDPNLLIDINGTRIDPDSAPYMREHHDLLSGKTYYSPATGAMQTIAGASGLENVARLPGQIAPVGGGPALPASSLAPVNTGVDDQGHQQFQLKSDLMHPGQTTAGAGRSAAFIPSVSTTQTPGDLPTTTTRTKGGAGGGGGGSVSASTSVPPNLAAKGAKEAPRPEIAAEVNDVVNGRTSLEQVPTKKRGAVNQYLNRNGLTPPTALTQAGQTAVARIDPVMSEIDGLVSRLDGIKGKNLAADFIKYKLGRTTPYNDIFTNTAFERLRSASAALAGTGSRAYQALQQGLEHTPTFDRLHGLMPDEVTAMIGKLTEARKLLQGEREATLQDQRKSGVIGGAGGIPPVDMSGGSGGATEVERGPDGKLRIKQ